MMTLSNVLFAIVLVPVALLAIAGLAAIWWHWLSWCIDEFKNYKNPLRLLVFAGLHLLAFAIVLRGIGL